MDMDKTGYIQYFNESEALTIPLDVWNDSNQAREGYLSMTFETGSSLPYQRAFSLLVNEGKEQDSIFSDVDRNQKLQFSESLLFNFEADFSLYLLFKCR
jgi:hypothetical protein